ncbi:hypothetical protein IH741_24170, partial [Escherichia coli]|nr:hypothetical protein [Escherichia coli]
MPNPIAGCKKRPAAAGGYAAGRFLQPAIGFGKEMSRVQALTRIDQNSPQ